MMQISRNSSAGQNCIFLSFHSAYGKFHSQSQCQNPNNSTCKVIFSLLNATGKMFAYMQSYAASIYNMVSVWARQVGVTGRHVSVIPPCIWVASDSKVVVQFTNLVVSSSQLCCGTHYRDSIILPYFTFRIRRNCIWTW